ncbi:sensor histidine kinase [Aneurinibacillus tyrosinisolvens]|uniref:sensor histidine kinase n=1 Tax=Aneurinibacillus tyrosinisolvens TaxID=1443435 RepID=UPI00063EF2EC|nr:ATP-binding protein [Aneurinibacillus tyrosinisolvens]
MRLKTKLNLVTTVWLLFILILLNTTIYYLFIRITTETETDMLQRKGQEIAEKLTNGQVNGKTDNILASFLPESSIIRIVNLNRRVINEVTNDPSLRQIEPDFNVLREWELNSLQDYQVLTVRVPIQSNGHTVECIEISEKLIALAESVNTLLYALFMSSVAAILLSLVGGTLLSRFILRPISKMIHTMEGIQKSGVLKNIAIERKAQDELSIMAKTFNGMMDRLQDNFDKQQQFVSDASHELKTPLTIIESYANLLRRWGMKDEALQRESIDAIYSEAIRMKKMTQQLLDLASLEKENTLDIQQIDLLPFCEEVANPLRKVYKREIKLIYPDEPVVIWADEMKMNQVLLILLDNALKYSKGKIEIYVSKKKEWAFIKIKDYGIGIPKDELSIIFERFYRVDKARHRETGGSGLGLSIAKHIVSMHFGKIKLESEEGKGTEVTICLPIKNSSKGNSEL